jgi:hypothetical protein
VCSLTNGFNAKQKPSTRAIAESCPQLRALNLCMSRGVTAAGVSAILRACPGLSALCLGWIMAPKPTLSDIIGAMVAHWFAVSMRDICWGKINW